MPISSFGKGLANAVTFLPGTYATALMRNHAMGATLDEMNTQSVPHEVTDALRDLLDCNIYFFGRSVPEPAMYAILASSIVILVAIYVLLNKFKKTNK